MQCLMLSICHFLCVFDTVQSLQQRHCQMKRIGKMQLGLSMVKKQAMDVFLTCLNICRRVLMFVIANAIMIGSSLHSLKDVVESLEHN